MLTYAIRMLTYADVCRRRKPQLVNEQRELLLLAYMHIIYSSPTYADVCYTYADVCWRMLYVCWRMLTYAVGANRSSSISSANCSCANTCILYTRLLGMLTYADVCWRMLTCALQLRAYMHIIYSSPRYADVCWRMLTYADVCTAAARIHAYYILVS